MAAKVPIRAVFDGTTATGLAEYQSGDFIALTYGGLGVSLSLGSAGQILKVNSAGDAVEFGSGAVALDDVGTGDAASTLATSAGNITIDAQGNNTDIIFKGTDASSDITMLTLDGSEAGAATFNDKIVATELDISGDVDVDGTLEADAYTVDGTTLAEYISDTAGGMVSSNTETGITATYQAADNTIDFAIDAAQTTITSIYATDLIMGEDSQTAIDFGTANEIDFKVDNAARLTLTTGALYPVTDNQIDLGTSSLEFKDAFFDGTVTSDAFAGPLTGDVTGNADTATALATARTIGGTSFDGTGNIAVALAATATTLANARTIGGVSFDGSANINLPGVNASGSQDTSGTAATVTVTDSTANTNFPVVFHDESNALLDDTGALRYNPSTGELLVPNLTVAGTTTQVDTVTMQAENAVIFEGATADAHETTLTIVDPTADRTINLPNQSGTVPVLAAASNTAVTSTPEELNILDGATVVVGEINALDLGSTAVGTAIASKAVILDSSKDYTGIRNFTITGELDAATGDFSGDVDVDGTLEADAITVDGTTLAEFIADTAGGMVSSNTETGIAVTYQDADNTIDFVIDAAQTAITSIYNTSLAIGYGSSHANIDFGTDNRIVFDIDGTSQILLLDGVFRPTTDSDVDLGSSAKYWKDAYIDTVTTTGLITSGSNLVIANAGNIGSAGDTDAIAIASDGVVTFSQVPVLPNNTIETADIQDNAVSLAKMAGLARGKIIYGDSSGDPAALAVGSANYVLTSDGTDISWAEASGSFDPDGAVVINESSADVDFRVESNGNANMLFVDGGNDRVGIGTASPAEIFHIYSTANDQILKMESTGGNAMIDIVGNRTGNGDIGHLRWYNNGGSEQLAQLRCERESANNSGTLKVQVSNAGAMNDIMQFTYDQQIFTTQSNANTFSLVVRNSHSSQPIGQDIYFNGAAPDDNTQYFFRCRDTAGGARLYVFGDGDVQNHDNAYGSISDERIKQDVRDANSQWDDIKAVKVRNFIKKDDVRQYGDDAWEQIGVIAQELEQVSPKLIRHSNPSSADILSDSTFGTIYEVGDDIPEGKEIGDVKELTGEKVKSVQYSVLYMKAIKALQEAMTRIETLESEVAALKE